MGRRAVAGRRVAGRGVRLLTASVAGLVVAAALTVLPWPFQRGASASGLVPVRGPMHGDPNELEDGFAHLVVGFDDGVTSSAPRGAPAQTATVSAAPAGTVVPEAAAPAPGEGWRAVPVTEVDGVADVAELASLAAHERILRLARDPVTDQLVAVVASSGPSEPQARTAATREALPSADPSTGDQDVELVGVAPDDPHVVALTSVRGTREIEGVGGGWYAVTTEADPSDYEALDGVRSVVEDVPLSVSVDPSFGDQWHLRNTGGTVAGITGSPGADVGAEDAWAVAEGSGIVVAVVDSGMEITHPDLAARVWSNNDDCGDLVDDDHNGYVDDCHGWDLLNGDSKVDDVGPSRWGGTIDNTHATHVAGIVAAERDNGIGVTGLAPRARIMPVKISDASSMSMSTAATAIRYAADNGADIVNCSFGTNAGTTLAQVAPMQDAVRYAQQKGVLVVAAAGNDNRDIDAFPTFPASLPEANVLSVGASTNADTRASFSNWGATSVDLFAPGWSVVSTLPGGRYGSLHGTSMATPVVAAAAALVMEAKPALRLDQLEELLMTASTPVAELAGRSVSGQRLDIGRVLNPSGAQREEPVSFTFDGFDAAVADHPVLASIDAVVAPGVAPAGVRVAYRATLLTNVGGVAYGVSNAAITTNTGVAVTDANASVLLSPVDGYPGATASATLAAGFTLPAGDYALVAEAVSADGGSTFGRPWAVFFTVAAQGDAVPPPATVPIGAPPGPGGSAPVPARPPGGSAPVDPVPDQPAPAPPAPDEPLSGGSPWPTSPSRAGASPGDWTWGWWTLPAGGSWTQPAPSTDWSWTWPTPSSDGSWAWPAPAPPRSFWPAPAPTPPAAPGEQPSPSPRPAPSQPSPPIPPPPAPVTNGTLTVRSLEPRWGGSDGGTRVRIDGEGYGGTMRVLFGTSPGSSVTVLSSTSLLVTTPPHASPGTVDVRVATATTSVVLPSAFTYVAPGATPAPGPGGTTPSPAHRPAAPAPGPAPPATTPPTASTPPTAVPPADPALAVGFRFGEVTSSRGALQLRPLLGPSPLDGYAASTWGGRRCRTSSCAGTKLP